MIEEIFSHMDSIQISFSAQILTFIMTMIVTHMVWRESNRRQTPFYKYFTIGCSLLLIQSGLMLIVLFQEPEPAAGLAAMPMIDHLLRIGGLIFLAFSFTTIRSTVSAATKHFFTGNLWLLFISTPLILSFWWSYHQSPQFISGEFGNFWGDRLYESWTLLLLAYGLYLILKSGLKAKGIFAVAFVILLSKQLLLLSNLVLYHNTIVSIFTIDRLLQIPFFYVIIIAMHQEIVHEVEQLNHENEHLDKRLYDSVIQALVGSLEIKDPYTEGHAKRVTDYSLQIGRELKLCDVSLRNLYLGAILHDIGKIGTQLDVLNKVGELDADERHVIKRHTSDGTSLVSTIDDLKHVVPTILYHHERWDGTGYPHGLAGSDIPLDARIVAVADAFDAMTTDRAYRQALCMEKVLTELKAGKEKQFDPHVVDVFIQILQESQNLACGISPELNSPLYA